MPISSAPRAPGLALAAVDQARRGPRAALLRGLGEAQRRAAGRVDLRPVVRLDDLDVPVRERRGRLRDELRQSTWTPTLMFGSQRTGTRSTRPARARSRASLVQARRAADDARRPAPPAIGASARVGRGDEKSTTTSARACSIAASPSTTVVPIGPTPASSPASRPTSVRRRRTRSRWPCACARRDDRAAHPTARADDAPGASTARPARKSSSAAAMHRARRFRGRRRAATAPPSFVIAAHRERGLDRRGFDSRNIASCTGRSARCARRASSSLPSSARRVARETSAGRTFDVTLMTPRAPHGDHRQRERVVAAQDDDPRRRASATMLLRAKHVAGRLLRRRRRSAPPRQIRASVSGARSTPVRAGDVVDDDRARARSCATSTKCAEEAVLRGLVVVRARRPSRRRRPRARRARDAARSPRASSSTRRRR